MIKRPAAARVANQTPANETEEQRFVRILLRLPFQPLKAVFDHLDVAVPVMLQAITTTYSYQGFLDKLGYRTTLVPHLHEQDCYTRLGLAGGIRAVVPLHDQTTYSTFVTLVNFDSTLTTTPKAIDFYDAQLAAFKTQLMNP